MLNQRKKPKPGLNSRREARVGCCHFTDCRRLCLGRNCDSETLNNTSAKRKFGQAEGAPKKKFKANSSHHDAIKKAANAIEMSAKQAVITKDEDEPFGSLVEQLMKKIPDEVKDDLRIDSLTLIRQYKS